jgi:hypothetical protein
MTSASQKAAKKSDEYMRDQIMQEGLLYKYLTHPVLGVHCAHIIIGEMKALNIFPANVDCTNIATPPTTHFGSEEAFSGMSFNRFRKILTKNIKTSPVSFEANIRALSFQAAPHARELVSIANGEFFAILNASSEWNPGDSVKVLFPLFRTKYEAVDEALFVNFGALPLGNTPSEALFTNVGRMTHANSSDGPLQAAIDFHVNVRGTHVRGAERKKIIYRTTRKSE